ncbi:MAG: response regulator transcription factor [Deltaproteobacteria bacterium]|nr:response regulator transcription factor [Deltaproteobacteria bacterium]MBW2086743.1 response regulator transcription factor [Deltaproteobacteria bacterium]
MKKKHRIVIAEDHTMLREGLLTILNLHDDFVVVGEAKDGLEAIRTVGEWSPDLILMDLSMPKMSGLDAIEEIKKRYPETKVLALTIHEDEEYVLAALQAGADGYLLKDASHTELATAIRTVLSGKPYLCPGISSKVIEGYLEGRRNVKSAWDILTQREREILTLIVEGYRNKEIANSLYISPKTVEKHRSNLMRKLDLHNTSALISFAIKRGLVAT